MVKALRKRPRPDNIVNQTRRPDNKLGRRVYLLLLAVLGLGFLNYVWGDFIILRGEGLVVRDETAVATTFVAKVTSVNVTQGKLVRKGDVLLQISSTDLLERLADLSMQQANVSQMATELRLRLEIARHLLPLAAKRDEETNHMLSRFESTADSGYVTAASYREAIQAGYAASADIIRLTAENTVLRSKIKELDAAQEDASNALQQLRESYADGVLRATTDGAVGAKIPSVGDVFRPGELMMSIHSGESYILTYLPSRYLFTIHPGMKVSIAGGRESSMGVVAEILPLSDALPTEFQSSFKPRERNQLAKIRIAEPHKFPVGEKVWISRRFF